MSEHVQIRTPNTTPNTNKRFPNTNGALIARELERRCNGNHEHGQLLSGRAGPAARYTEELCQAIVRGILAQKESDRKGCAIIGEINDIRVITEEQQKYIDEQS